jgi:hypothetical protein
MHVLGPMETKYEYTDNLLVYCENMRGGIFEEVDDERCANIKD